MKAGPTGSGHTSLLKALDYKNDANAFVQMEGFMSTQMGEIQGWLPSDPAGPRASSLCLHGLPSW